MALHEITRMRREVVRRKLTVANKQFVTPRMLRIDFHSDELEGFNSPSPDDHIKIFLPLPDGQEARRDFTPRAWDETAGTITLEFALHDRGPAADWARAAQPGDTLIIGGPKGSAVVPDDFEWYILIGDVCAFPSFARRLEGLRAGAPVSAYLLVADDAEQQPLPSKATVGVRWLADTGHSTRNAEQVRNAMQANLPAGDGYIWIAGETVFAREMYDYVVTVQEHPAAWVKAAAYWTAD